MAGPAAPTGSGKSGRRLWRSVTSDWLLAEHELAQLRQAVHVVDVCDQLQDQVTAEGLMLDGKINPALVELRQQRALFGRLMAALRVPVDDGATGEDAPADELAPRRTQRRSTRGFYGARGDA
jgi:hypothetical protein